MPALKTRVFWGGLGLLMGATVQASPIPVVDATVPSTATSASNVAVVATVQAAPVTQGDAVTRLLQQLDAMQKELAEVRGQMEEQRHQLEQMKREQKDRYLDLDRRMGALAVQAKSAPPPAPASVAGNTSPKGPVVSPASEQEAYQAAFSLIRQRDFAQAVVALEGFLKQYPTSDLSANALYWLGEVQLAQTDYPKAKSAFEQVLKDFPDSAKSSDATYKLGRTLIQMGDDKGGKHWLQKTLTDYPDSSAARLASEYLKGLK